MRKDGKRKKEEARPLANDASMAISGPASSGSAAPGKPSRRQTKGGGHLLSTALLANLPGLAYRFRHDPSGTVVFVSQGCFDLTGYAPDDFLGDRGLSLTGLIHPDDLDLYQRLTKQALIEHAPYRLAYRIITGGGRERWVWDRGNGVYGRGGKVEALEGIMLDLTERQETMTALEASQERFARVFNASPTPMLIISSPEGICIDANESLLRLTGFAWNDLTGRFTGQLAIWANSDDYRLLSDQLTLAHPLENVEIALRTASGERRHGLISLKVIQLSGEEFILAAVVDITDLKLIQQALAESEARYRQFVDLSPSAILVEQSGKLVFVNPAAVSLLGAKEATQLLGRSVLDFVMPEGREPSMDKVRWIVSGDKVQPLTEERLIGLDGKIHDVEVFEGPFEFEGAPATQTVIRDVTERKRMLAELEATRLEQLHMKDRFLSHVSHELRSPLAAVYEFITILLDGIAGEITDEQREYMEIILRNVEQLRSMIGDLLDLSRAETGKLTVEPRCVSMENLINDSISTYRTAIAANGLELRVELPESLPPVYADRERIRQVLGNLLDNAIKFTPENGLITVAVKKSVEETGFLHLSVSDNGVGINHANLERIFDRHFQDENADEYISRRGLGIGLTICKELVNRHGGRIWVNSAPGKGSTFQFTLPAFPPPDALAKILSSDGAGGDTLALLAVEVRPVGGRFLIRTDERMMAETAAVLQGSLREPYEAIFPRIWRIPTGEASLVVSRLDQSNLAELARRLRETLISRQKINTDLRIELYAATVKIEGGTHLTAPEIDPIIEKAQETISRFFREGEHFEEWEKQRY